AVIPSGDYEACFENDVDLARYRMLKARAVREGPDAPPAPSRVSPVLDPRVGNRPAGNGSSRAATRPLLLTGRQVSFLTGRPVAP
ncbi:hypothetical protein ABTX86_17335, partial [Streptomyces anulatus]